MAGRLLVSARSGQLSLCRARERFPFEATASGAPAAITGPYYHCRSNREAGQNKVMARGTYGHFLALRRSQSLGDPDVYMEVDNLAGGRKCEKTKCPPAC